MKKSKKKSLFMRINNKFLRIAARIAAGLFGLTAVVILLFYILIVFGASENLQNTWVCSAMHSYNHKYLATWFFSDDKINEILDRNAVEDNYDDSGMVIDNKPFEDNSGKEQQYFDEGYEKLSEGIYKKEVSGTSSGFSWVGYVLLISDPTRVHLAQTPNQFKYGATVMEMVEQNDAIAGINGGGFIDGESYDSDGGIPAGLMMLNGDLINPAANDDVIYHIIAFNRTGHLVLKKGTVEWAINHNMIDAVSFAPFIVVNNQGMITNGTGGWGISPRTGIAQRATGEVLFIVIDGRQVGYSMGSDLDGLQEIMLNEKCVNGAMMDGGGSTAMVYEGKYVNKPSLGRERWINNCWIVDRID